MKRSRLFFFLAGTVTAALPSAALAQAIAPPVPVAPDALPAKPEDVAVSSAGSPSAPQPTVAPKVVAPPSDLTVGKTGLFRPGVLLQGWYTGNFPGSDVGEYGSTFRIRRAEITLKGEAVPQKVSYSVMLDPAKLLEFQDKTLSVKGGTAMGSVTARQPNGNVGILQDLYFTYQTTFADVSMGQFKTPVSYEGYNSSGKLLFPERALVSRAYGDKRDLGVRVAKTFERFGYSAGIWNGSGTNTPDPNKAKDVGLRLEAYPVKGLLLAGVIYRSLGQRDSASPSDGQKRIKDRYEFDARYETSRFLVQAEYIRAHEVPALKPVNAQGFYVAGAMRVIEPIQVALRIGYIDPDTSQNLRPNAVGDSVEVRHYEAVVNYFLPGGIAKLQLSFSHFDFGKQEYEPGDQISSNELILSTQTHF